LTSKCTNNGRRGKHRQTYCSMLYIPWISREDWEFDGVDMAKRTLLERKGVGEAIEVWDYRWRRSVRKYLNIRQCQLAPLYNLQPLQRAVAVQLPFPPKIPCHRKRREQNQPKKLTTSAGLIRVVSLLIIQDRPLSPTPFPTSSS
jgi:hypothetical protein